jgi:hypothetical protein
MIFSKIILGIFQKYSQFKLLSKSLKNEHLYIYYFLKIKFKIFILTKIKINLIK